MSNLVFNTNRADDVCYILHDMLPMVKQPELRVRIVDVASRSTADSVKQLVEELEPHVEADYSSQFAASSSLVLTLSR